MIIMTNEKIKEISGTDTEPFNRFSYKIPLDELIILLNKSKQECEVLGYSNLKLHVNEQDGLIDMYVYGDREYNQEELELKDETDVILRRKVVSSIKGLTREQIFKKNDRI